MSRPGFHVRALTPLRGLAALTVVLFHCLVSYGETSPRAEILKVAVTFFFILSGFVLTFSWAASTTSSTFWIRRIARLLPLYLLAWLLAVAGRSALTWFPTNTDFVVSLLLVQAWLPGEWVPLAVNPPAWSLSCEAFFYLCLPFIAPRLLSCTRRQLAVVTGCTVAWLVAAATTAVWFPIEWWIGYRGAEFMLGVLLAVLWRRSEDLHDPTVTGAGAIGACVLVLLIVLGVEVPPSIANLLAAAVALAVILHAVTRPAFSRAVDRPLLNRLGGWSYALYITHWIIVVLVTRASTSVTAIPLAIILSVVVAATLHTWFERPIERWLLSKRARSDTVAPNLIARSYRRGV